MVRLLSAYSEDKYTVQGAIEQLELGRTYAAYLKRVANTFGDIFDFDNLEIYSPKGQYPGIIGRPSLYMNRVYASLKPGFTDDDFKRKVNDLGKSLYGDSSQYRIYFDMNRPELRYSDKTLTVLLNKAKR